MFEPGVDFLKERGVEFECKIHLIRLIFLQKEQGHNNGMDKKQFSDRMIAPIKYILSNDFFVNVIELKSQYMLCALC